MYTAHAQSGTTVLAVHPAVLRFALKQLCMVSIAMYTAHAQGWVTMLAVRPVLSFALTRLWCALPCRQHMRKAEQQCWLCILCCALRVNDYGEHCRVHSTCAKRNSSAGCASCVALCV